MSDRAGKGKALADWPRLRYFDEVFADEREAINHRRKRLSRPNVVEPTQQPWDTSAKVASLIAPVATHKAAPAEARPPAEGPPTDKSDARLGGDAPPDHDRTRPKPVPSNVTGVCLSGGGVRSAAFCLGVLQALDAHGLINGVDYLSTVSGGGYIGSSMTAAMSQHFKTTKEVRYFPFQKPCDPSDTRLVGHLRNYSNYLMPRSRGTLRNGAEGAAILLRGILANAIIVAAVMLFLVSIVDLAYPDRKSLLEGSFLPSLSDAGLSWYNGGLTNTANNAVGPYPFALTLWLLGVLAFLLVGWALTSSVRSFFKMPARGGDAEGPFLWLARKVFGAVAICAVFDLMPVVVAGLARFYDARYSFAAMQISLSTLSALFVGVGGFASKLGAFFKTTPQPGNWSWLWRVALIWAGAVALPAVLLLVFAQLALWGLSGWPALGWYLDLFAVLAIVGFVFQPNAYSLHQYYRDRLAKAFLFNPDASTTSPAEDSEAKALDHFKLADLEDVAGPYHILNAALNVQGSREANRRGRGADFFHFSQDYVGSDLTLYAPSRADDFSMEKLEPALDLASAAAISGAAIAANMGSATIAPLSPTLALLNVRLGYWLVNPRYAIRSRWLKTAAPHRSLGRLLADGVRALFRHFYLIPEMFNLLDETSKRVLLTDGGHLENLGLYELLKRGCQVIIVADGEADPSLSFAAFNKAERYARIDFGVRIELPWQRIAETSAKANGELVDNPAWRAPGPGGPHTALGRIVYADGSEGLLIYVKASITGDEPDYVLDYKSRHPEFPHETTADQFFTEEQFESYRALGFHVLDHCLEGTDTIASAFTATNTAPIVAWAMQMMR